MRGGSCISSNLKDDARITQSTVRNLRRMTNHCMNMQARNSSYRPKRKTETKGCDASRENMIASLEGRVSSCSTFITVASHSSGTSLDA
eukprot:2515254-Amphidinium_carterae.1